MAFEPGEPAWDRPAPVPESAADALAAVASSIAAWRRDLASVGDDRLWAPMGSAAGPFGDSSVAGFVEHIHDEFVHHTAELGLLRDLYRAGLTADQAR
ncbi:MAG: DinB family protein [Acidimicrobiales bacterium]